MKVSAQYPGRSALCLNSSSPRRVERTESRESGMTAVAEVSRGHSSFEESWDEGPNVKEKKVQRTGL